MKKYVVREGDTMWKISKATGVRLNLLLAANPQIRDPDRLKPGTVIVIPELHKTAPPSPSTAPPLPHGQTGTTVPQPAEETIPPFFGFVWPHVVEAGDTWESIAQRYGVPLFQLEQMNPGLTGTALREGEVVYVPVASEQVQPGAMPSQMMYPGVPMSPGYAPPMPAPLPATPMEPADAQGPHTHHPYRYPAYGYHAGKWPSYPITGRPPGPVHPGYWTYVYYPPLHGPVPFHAMAAPHPYGHMPSHWHAGWADSPSWGDSWSSWSDLRDFDDTPELRGVDTNVDGTLGGNRHGDGASRREQS